MHRKIQGDGVELAVQVRGNPSGPTLVLLHGYPDTHRVWDGVVERLAPGFRVVTYDMRGAGESGRPRGRAAYRFVHLMKDLRAVLDEAGPGGPVHLAGHDWGAIQGWEAVTTMPERFASYTAISGPCLDHVGGWSRNGARPSARLAQALRSWYIGFFQLPLLPALAWRSGLAARILTGADGLPEGGHFAPTLRDDGTAGVSLYRANMPSRLLRPRERSTDVPVQVVIPTRDPFVTAHLAESALHHVPDLRFARIPARHWAPVTHPEEVAGLVAEHAGRV
ncbi:alpha/beta fold hydrolase [Actinocorallia sp. B10E7]|uniref:alpha/beta fold hydrolase n=1 Tax=Actinocorallia sp. B10E7 TaxID=3153558 RepID=UPI00325F45AE